ncbi:hypothetical protein PV11_01168 [Exophiala sideris]|uniref:tRNA (adenine(58)-N(1))-methyltransferase catalytic subunit TRM61 n=1 Tax=Exophiala sideris TaxID=1016849 RepID=A0A0D1XC29_9EURO|nr:hypothetical protein PV11_01168 [Exophiala sideris]
MVSSFLSPATITKEHDLASLHLSRDQSLPVILSTEAINAADEGYAEGVVTNTRFGSFPHSTIIGTPWGSQIRASIVDTGSRGRGGPKKRKAEALENDDGAGTKNAVTASSGFVHVLPPTPENWTTSLPHRTQVVYTPDYSYILHSIRARPGSRLIEAGSGSGSFTHAAARAVFDGYPQQDAPEGDDEGGEGSKSTGQVFSFEYHAERHQKVKAEMAEHGLDTVISAFHRDVYKDGFLVGNERQTSPRANAVFLDLPAPWEALPHLTRHTSDGTPSSLDPESAVHICTFSPCIEQVQKTVSELRRHDWLEIEMVEVQHKRIDIRREYTSLQYESLRGTNPFAVDVDEAVSKLREVEQRARDFHAGILSAKAAKALNNQQHNKLANLPFNGGKLIHRTEPDLKTHTSYLVFALLPRAWTEEDEAVAQAKWSKHVKMTSNVPKSQRQLKKEAKQKSKGTNGVEITTEVEKEGPATEGIV